MVDWKTVAKNGIQLNLDKFVIAGFQYYYKLVGKPTGFTVMADDWDYLIILDACRYDFFKEENWLQGTLEKRRSLGGNTIEWAENNFTDYYDDVVYVTGNPKIADEQYYRVADGISHEYSNVFPAYKHFHSVVPVYAKDDVVEGGKVRPEAVTREGLNAVNHNPDMRVILHYVSPHEPFLNGPCRGKIKSLIEDGRSWEEIRSAYRASLQRVLETIEDFVNEVEGRIVITADHGELLGEYGGCFRHHQGMYVKELIDVPYLKVNH